MNQIPDRDMAGEPRAIGYVHQGLSKDPWAEAQRLQDYADREGLRLSRLIMEPADADERLALQEAISTLSPGTVVIAATGNALASNDAALQALHAMAAGLGARIITLEPGHFATPSDGLPDTSAAARAMQQEGVTPTAGVGTLTAGADTPAAGAGEVLGSAPLAPPGVASTTYTVRTRRAVAAGAEERNDYTRVLEQANAWARKGIREKAIATWTNYLVAASGEMAGLAGNQLGDILALSGRPADAEEVYAEAAAILENAGFLAKAITPMKKILRVNPRRVETYRELARLSGLLDRVSEASQYYMSFLRELQRAERVAEVPRTLAAIRILAPTDGRHRVRLAKELLDLELLEEAVAEFISAAELFTRCGDPQTGLEHLRTAHHLLPNRTDITALEHGLKAGGGVWPEAGPPGVDELFADLDFLSPDGGSLCRERDFVGHEGHTFA